ncbi:hypothetical protein [Phenylobacterium sp.]|jgi:hypothetical protein|uniref:hypothetical protein n=1 Tax=Phenylobacterium sp. TaxID=1871053 RepID=UPI002E2F2C26|nr:hypothetical protein [Phenylobacterium sp.]HEX3365605.1 hypothetical protein [Phenylobacterium sp.]
MTDALRRDVRPEPEPARPEDHPRVFTRAIVTPPAPPWEQARAANLDARHGAPLPLPDLVHRVRRLSGWAPGRPGRFAVFYVRAAELRGPFEAAVEVEGQTVKVAFGQGGASTQRIQSLAAVLLLFGLTGAVLGAGAVMALNARAEATGQLEAAEKLAAAKLAAAQGFHRQVVQARDLHTALGAARPIADVLADLSWVGTSKTPEARVAAVHWKGGVMAVEVRGEDPPFPASDRRLERATRPLRPGVWLWGVGPRSAQDASAPAGAVR